MSGNSRNLLNSIEKYVKPIYWKFSILRGDIHHFEAVVNDVYLVVNKDYDSERPLKPFVQTIAFNLFNDRSRKEKRRSKAFGYRATDEEESINQIQGDVNTEINSNKKDIIELINNALDWLKREDEKKYIVIYLHYIKGLKLKEIATQLDVKYASVKQWNCRGKRKLKEYLEACGLNWEECKKTFLKN